MYLKRHILSHYMNDFKERYKEYPLICPYCNHPSSCVKHNMIHIAITHRKLKELLPENLSTQLMQNGVLEINDDIAEQIMEPPQMMMEGAAAATLEDGQGGDVDASGEEDMVTMMDPSMFMDTMMTEDQSGEALDFGGEGSEAESSPRKRQREAGEENGGNPAKRQELGSGVGAAMAYPGMKPDQEMVAPDLMYPNSEQVCTQNVRFS